MKSTNRSLSIFIFTLFLLTGITSCKKLIQVSPPINGITNTEAFGTDATAVSAVMGAYFTILTNSFYYYVTLYPGLSSDELLNSTNPSDPFETNTLAQTTSQLGSFIWTPPYAVIYQTNNGIESLLASTTLTDTLKTQLIGELETIRAFQNFYLVNIFGNCPLISTSNYTENASVGRTSRDSIYSSIVSDLKDAITRLPVNPAVNNDRITRNVAIALLSRVYLYVGDYQDALTEATAVINSNDYHLQTSLNSVFLIGSTEAIFQLNATGTGSSTNTYIGKGFIPSSTSVIPPYVVNNDLLQAFESGDLRMANWLKANTVNGVKYYYAYKYKVRSSSTITEGAVLLRLAEQYLIRSEAEAQLGDIQDAQTDLNVIRARAGLPATTATSVDSLLLAIEHERRVELFAEFGDRWFNLKRTNRADAVLGMEKAGWQSYDTLYPIPYSQQQLNPQLYQNTGY